MYVWFDALGNYITALDYGTDGDLFQQYWGGASERVHIIGKGITRFHAIYWPAMLLSANLPLPSRILVHGYVTVDGEKISKSTGTAIDPVPVVRELGADALRYYLLRHVRSTEDGDFSHERLRQAYRSELADQLGNLARRTLSMIDRYFDGIIPSPALDHAAASNLAVAVDRLPRTVQQHVERYALHEAVIAIWEVIGEANKYVSFTAPWALAKRCDQPHRSADAVTAEARLEVCLYELARALDVIVRCGWPFLPSTCERLSRQLGAPSPHSTTPLAGRKIAADRVLFPKLG